MHIQLYLVVASTIAILNVVLYFYLLFLHCCNLENVRLQAHYLRIAFVVPLISILSMTADILGTVADAYMEIFFVVSEGIALITFFVLLVSISAPRVDVKDSMHNQEITVFRTTIKLSNWFSNSSVTFTLLYWCVCQFLIVRLFDAAVLLCLSSISHVNKWIEFITAVILNDFVGVTSNMISLCGILVTIATLQVYT